MLDDLGLVRRSTSVVAIGSADLTVPQADVVEAYEVLSGPDDLPKTLRVALGIVVSPLDFMARTVAEQLLSRLRDIHCEKVVLIDTNNGWTPEDLRALGYLEVGQAWADRRCYLFDPDAFNQPREWNNRSNWANPENFRKYRW